MSNTLREEGEAMQNTRLDIIGMFDQIDQPGQGIAREAVARQLARYLAVQISSIRKAYGIRLPELEVHPKDSEQPVEPSIQHIDRGTMIDHLLEAQQGRLSQGQTEKLLLGLKFQIHRLRGVVAATMQQRFEHVTTPASDAATGIPVTDAGIIDVHVPETPVDDSAMRDAIGIAA